MLLLAGAQIVGVVGPPWWAMFLFANLALWQAAGKFAYATLSRIDEQQVALQQYANAFGRLAGESFDSPGLRRRSSQGSSYEFHVSSTRATAPGRARPGRLDTKHALREGNSSRTARAYPSSVTFRNSKRFPPFLRYTVEHALNSSEPLKERTIGHEVFGRDPGYDTGQYPIVRMTAAEVRKRLRIQK